MKLMRDYLQAIHLDMSSISHAHQGHTVLCTGAEYKQWLEMFKNHSSEVYSPTTTNYTEYVTNIRLSGVCGDGFEHVDISSDFGLNEPVFVSMRKDSVRMFLDKVQACTDKVHLRPQELRDDHGQRLYGDFYTANRWHEMQVSS